ncbi:MAG: hypothetical protein ACI8QY_000961, partial [bacterium]
MKLFNTAILLFLALFVVTLLPAQAQGNEDAFSVKNYEIVYKSGNVKTFREKAIKKATHDAFPKLLRQLTPHETWGLHSRLLEHVNWDEVSYKTHIVSEEGQRHYKAVLDVYYRAKPVKDLLTRFNIPYSERTGGKVLILPVFESAGTKLLWETVNPLKPIVAENMRTHSYFDYVLPTGDIAEVTSLSAEMASL